MFATLQSFIPDSLPTVSLPAINTDPLSLDINQVGLYASTHNFEFLGQEYRSGLLTEMDATVATTERPTATARAGSASS